MSILSEVLTHLHDLLGLGASPQALTMGQITARAFLIYLVGYALLRFGEHRFLGKNTAFDVILGFVFGSMLSRAINGSGPFLATILAGAILLALHWLMATATLRSERLDEIISGLPLPLIKDGEVQEDGLRRSRISKSMLRENLRINGQLRDPDQVQEAYYEPSGVVSVIPKDRGPRVVEVRVEEGVQTVRVELHGT